MSNQSRWAGNINKIFRFDYRILGFYGSPINTSVGQTDTVDWNISCNLYCKLMVLSKQNII